MTDNEFQGADDTSSEEDTFGDKDDKETVVERAVSQRSEGGVDLTQVAQISDVDREELAAMDWPETAATAEEGPTESEEEIDAARSALPWYVVQTYSGFELRVKLSLEERVRSLGLTRKFGRIIVPQETVEEVGKGGAKKTSTKKFFPGYILVQMHIDDDTWHVVKDTPKVSGFIGDSRHPAPLSQPEIAVLLQQMEGGAKRPRPKKSFEEGDAIKVTEGPFAEFNGTVDEVKPDKGKLRVLISIFGRNTPVELDFSQVEKV